ncbi:MAG: hypothetical protein KDK78_07790, partial [Chlamydiia bacterium]|nr:hypothetical protein [Chlamydiia bacterium]
NKKQGMCTAWYEDGSLMFVEEYDKDRLIQGKYLRPGEHTPISRVAEGSGIATLFDADGKFIRKICYEDGEPVER